MADDSLPTVAYKDKWEQVRATMAVRDKLRALLDQAEKELCVLVAFDPEFTEKYKASAEFWEEVADRANEVRGLLK